MQLEETVPVRRRGFFSLVGGMIIQPVKTHQYLSEYDGRAWLILAALAIAFTTLPVIVGAPIMARVAQETLRQQMDEQSGMYRTMPPEAQQQAIQAAANPLFITILPSLASVAGLWIGWLAWAGALHLLGTMLGGASSFAKMWQTVIWSWLPYTLRGVLQTGYILASGEMITPGLSGLVTRNGTSADLIMSPPGSGELALTAFLSHIDIFLLWSLALLIIGVAASARLSHRKALLVTLIVWMVLTLISLVPAVITGMFSGAFS